MSSNSRPRSILLVIKFRPANPDGHPCSPVRQLFGVGGGVLAFREISDEEARHGRARFKAFEGGPDRFVRFDLQSLLNQLRAEKNASLPLFSDQKHEVHV